MRLAPGHLLDRIRNGPGEVFTPYGVFRFDAKEGKGAFRFYRLVKPKQWGISQ